MSDTKIILERDFDRLSPSELAPLNPFDKIGKEWMLITSMDENGRVNAMTASWGMLGYLWGRPAAICYVRPQRYTFGLTESSDTLSLCFLGEEYRSALKLCGTESGRDMDKLAATGLTSTVVDGTPMIDQSQLVIVCKKLYCDYIKPEGFKDPSIIGRYYPDADFHREYVCEIIDVYVRK